MPSDAVVKNPPASARDARDMSYLWVRKIPWSRKWQPTPVLLPGKFHGQKNLADYRSMGSLRVRHDWVTKHTHTHTKLAGIKKKMRNTVIHSTKSYWASTMCQGLCSNEHSGPLTHEVSLSSPWEFCKRWRNYPCAGDQTEPNWCKKMEVSRVRKGP